MRHVFFQQDASNYKTWKKTSPQLNEAKSNWITWHHPCAFLVMTPRLSADERWPLVTKIASGKLRVCYWKLWLMVDLRTWWFSIVFLVCGLNPSEKILVSCSPYSQYFGKFSKPPISFCMFTRWYPLPWKRNTDLLDDAFGSSDQMQQDTRRVHLVTFHTASLGVPM
jgi:hypothetical protein